MTNAETDEEKVVPTLRLLQGGKGPPINTEGKDWLTPLKKGAIFSCEGKGQNLYTLKLFRIVFKHTKTVILADALGNSITEAVNPITFCKLHNLFEVIEEGGERPVGDENDGDQVRSGGVADDENASSGQPGDDST